MIKGLSPNDMISISKSAERTELRLEKTKQEISELKDKLHRRNALANGRLREIKKLQGQNSTYRKALEMILSRDAEGKNRSYEGEYGVMKSIARQAVIGI